MTRLYLKRAALLVLGLFALTLLYLTPFLWQVYSLPASPTVRLAKSGHGLWLGHRWFYDKKFRAVTADEILQLGKRCRKLGFTDIYLHVGPISGSGDIPEFSATHWAQRQAELRKALGPVRIFAWLGAPNAAYLGPADDTLDLANLTVRTKIQTTLKQLLAVGFDGIHYDVEPLADNDEHFLELLKATRATLSGRPLSVAAPQLQPPGIPRFLPMMDRLWSPEYFESVSQQSDQIALMGYDTFQPTEAMYTRYLAYQTEQLRRLVHCELIIGVPTYEDNPPYHNPDAETIGAGLAGASLGGAEHIAVYAEWTTDAAEWEALAMGLPKSGGIEGGKSSDGLSRR